MGQKKKKPSGSGAVDTAEISSLAGKSIPRNPPKQLKQGEKGFTAQQFKGTPAKFKKRFKALQVKVAIANKKRESIARQKRQIRADAAAKLKRVTAEVEGGDAIVKEIRKRRQRGVAGATIAEMSSETGKEGAPKSRKRKKRNK